MIQDIYPHVFNNQYKLGQEPSGDCLIIHFDKDGAILIKSNSETDGTNRKIYPRLCEFIEVPKKLEYLFSMDEDNFFLAEDDEILLPEG